MLIHEGLEYYTLLSPLPHVSIGCLCDLCDLCVLLVPSVCGWLIGKSRISRGQQ